MLMKLQELCKSCKVPAIILYYILVWRKVARFLHTVLVQEFYFILFYCKRANRFNDRLVMAKQKSRASRASEFNITGTSHDIETRLLVSVFGQTKSWNQRKINVIEL